MNKKKLFCCGLLLTSSMLMVPNAKAADDDLILEFNATGGKTSVESCVVNRNNPQGCRNTEDSAIVLIKQGESFPTPEREGYVFEGWSIGNEYYDKLDYNFITEMNNNYNMVFKVPLTAQWIEIKDVVKTDSNVSVTIPTTSTDVNLSVSNVVENTDVYTNISTLLKTSKFQAFDIKITSQDVEVTPNGKITVTVNMPEGYDASSVTIYGISEDNNITKIESTIENGKITFTTESSYSYYAISSQSIETIISTETETTTETIEEEIEEVNPNTGDSIKYVIGGTGIIMLLIGFVTSKLFKKRNS